MSERDWELLPYFLLRSTGFPFGWLDRLAFADTAVAVEQLLECEDELTARREEAQQALKACRDTASRKLRQRYWKQLRQARNVDLDEQAGTLLDAALLEQLGRWNELLERRAALEAHARATFERELPARRQALREIASDTRFQEAIWLGSPHMFEHGVQSYLAHWDAHRRPTETRRIERQLASYIQRLCAKNDTTSFFGPLNYGDFAPGAQPPLAGPGAAGLQRRAAFVAYWGVAALAAAIAADPHVRPYLRPRRNPLCRLDERGAVVGGTVLVPLGQRAAELAARADGETATVELARQLALPLEAAVAEIEELVQVRVLLAGLDVPITEPRALEWLLGWTRELPPGCPSRAHWCARLESIKAIQDRFAMAPLPERQALLAQIEQEIQAITGQASRRGGGQLYADRLLLTEECMGGMSPLRLGPACSQAIMAQLAPVLNLMAAHASTLHAQLQAYGVEVLAELAPGGQMPLVQLISRLRGQKRPLPELTSPWEQALRQLVAAHAGARQVAIETAALPPMDCRVLVAAPLLASPDVLLLARDEAALRAGDFQLVLGESHDTLMIWGWPLTLHPERAAVEAAATDLLHRVADTGRTCNVLSSRRVKIVPFEYPGPSIEVQAASQKPRSERIAITEVTTAIEEGQPVLRAAGRAPLRLYNGELPTLLHRIFALPRIVPLGISAGEHTPRITLGKVVVQREQWSLPRAALLPRAYHGSSFELMYDVQRAARRLGLPRYVFVRTPNERKPVLIDRANYFLLELLNYLISDETVAQVTEMLPLPDQLWLRDEQQGAYCAELRLSVGYAAKRTDD